MSVLAPAIVDVRSPATDRAVRIANWLRGISVRQVRLACGLVMFSYIFSHFFNHALGNISYPAMEAWLYLHIWWWRIPIVNAALYAAAATHFSLGLWALYQRRHFRYTVAEIIQLVLGLSIPLLLASHFGAQRVSGWVFGRDPSNYATPLLGYWLNRPYMIAVQFVLLTVAWTHACIGHDRPRGEPAIQCSARQRVRRACALLDLPRSCRQRSQFSAEAFRPRGICVEQGGRQLGPLDPPCLSAAAADGCGHYSDPAAACRRRVRA